MGTIKPIERLVPVSFMRCRHFHTRPINVVVFHGSQGNIVFKVVSRLDAFSGYPFHI